MQTIYKICLNLTLTFPSCCISLTTGVSSGSPSSMATAVSCSRSSSSGARGLQTVISTQLCRGSELPAINNSITADPYFVHWNIHKTLWRNSYTFKGSNYDRNCFPPFWKGVYSKKKEFAPGGSKFFLFNVDPFQKWFGIQESIQEVTKRVSFVKKVRKSTKCIQSP